MVGYDPNDGVIYVGEGANKELTRMLYMVDKTKDLMLWRRIKDRVNELHWKTICYLVKNYDKIIIPDFRISGMVKQKKLSRMTKRLLYMFSFHSFMIKLKFKCKNTDTKLFIVGEEYTSKTCTQCGKINNVGSSEIYKCTSCNMVIDRDVNGSRNIMIKNMKEKLR
jgi:putative transposase